MAASLEARLLARIEFDTSGWGCWLWSGSMFVKGYGRIGQELVHRVAYELWVGPIPPDRPHVCHHCDTRPCIRPDHLFVGTNADNVADCVAKGRQGRLQGEAHGRAKLTDAQVLEIRTIQGVPHWMIGAMYGVSEPLIGRIRAGKLWKHVGLDAPDISP